ncbi:TrwC relaxase [Frankia sp. CcI49]|uniref:MobF family relaxase n=1 Tax=Frankia sp. CcI49 TaxID=1745382 RepID=UPI000977FD4E|nr:MobF family relaxase [Frankia sp. CcI49]ONH60400.1 TrwC relaxase [Frankia sp. CcI49]
MIATVKVLALRPRDRAAVGRAARAVVAYVEGGQPHAASPLRRYYGEGYAPGRPRGQAAVLTGLVGSAVSELALTRLLCGEHGVTGRPLLANSGSAGRAVASDAASSNPADGDPSPDRADEQGWLSLEAAARLVGVGASYLRMLAARTAERATAKSPPAAGAVTPEGLDAQTAGESGAWLAAERDPETGVWRVSRGEVERFRASRVPPAVVIGFDVTCSVPKSVSLLWAFGDEALRGDVAAAVDAGVDAVVTYLERHAVFGTVHRRNRTGLGLAVASYLHDVSRRNEAHLHVHSIVANAVAVPDTAVDREDDGVEGAGRDHAAGSGGDAGDPTVRSGLVWRALDGEVFLSHVRTAGFLGAAALRHELARRRGLRWGPVRNGVADLAGFPPALLAAFSTRSGEVADEYEQLVADGLAPGGRTKAAAQRGSRAPKKVLADEQVRRIQHDRLAAAGWTPEQVRALATPVDRDVRGRVDEELPALVDLVTGPLGATAQTTTFDRREVVRRVSGWAGDRLGAEEIENLTDQVLADPRIVLLGHPVRRSRQIATALYTTQELIEVEDTVLALCRQGRVDAGAAPRILVSPRLLDVYLDDGPPAPGPRPVSGDRGRTGDGPRKPDTATGPRLSTEQIELVRLLLGSGDLVRPVVGPAGTGKTEAMRLATRILLDAGHAVFAAAHGGRQTEELADRIAVPARVVAGWLTLLEHTDDPATVWPAGSVLIVDEATQIGSRDAERLLRWATRTGTVVILLGDPAQLGSVGAGGWFAHLVATTPNIPALTTLHRQAGAALAPVRAALTALRADTAPSARDALNRLAADGRVRLFDDRDAMLSGVVDDWYAARTAPSSAAAPSTSEPGGASGRQQRRSRRAAPAAPPAMVSMMAERTRDVEILARAARARLTADGTLTGPVVAVAGREFQVGDEVITLTQAGHTLVPAGRPASAYVRTGTLGIVTAVTLDPDVPERQTLDVHFPGKGDVTVPWEYLTHRFGDGRDGGLGYAYAITAAKAEGASMPTARAVAPDDTSRAGLYVMLSRAQTDLTAYVIRRADLEADADEEDWLPILRDPDGPFDRLAEHLAGSRAERLATDHDPLARAAHALRRTHTLAELHHLATSGASIAPQDAPRATAGRAGPPDGDATAGTGISMPVLRRAELAAEAAIRAAAVTQPPPALTARIGTRPAAGPDRTLWDQAVAALAIHHARHSPDSPPAEPGQTPTPGSAESGQHRWTAHRDLAVGLTRTWVDGLPDRIRRRFYSPVEQVPRHRAIAGLHALLDTGHSPDDLLSVLTRQDQTSARTGAAILDHRVGALCADHNLDPTHYLLPAPLSVQDEWADLVRLLDLAEIAHLARRPPADLATERRALTAAESVSRPAEWASAPRSGDGPAGPSPDRLRHLDAALDRQVGHALSQARVAPADYLTGLLGPRPAEEPAAAAWDTDVHHIERYRHRELGLPYGTAADPTALHPLLRAFGRPSADPVRAADYDQAISRFRAHPLVLDL